MGTFRICKRRFLLRTCYPYRQVSKTSNQMTYDNKVHIVITSLWVLDGYFYGTHLFNLAPPRCYTLNLKALNKVSKVSWTSQLSYKILCSSFERKFRKDKLHWSRKTHPRSPASKRVNLITFKACMNNEHTNLL